MAISGISFFSAYFGLLISNIGDNFKLYILILLGEIKPYITIFLFSYGLNFIIECTGSVSLYNKLPTVFLLKKTL